jgi:6-phosphogluconolactonase (cycloisomerase 2 family)
MVALAAVAAALSMPARAHAWASQCCMAWQAPDQVLFSGDGRFAYSSAYNVTLVMSRDPDSGALTVLDSYDQGAGAMELSRDGSSLYTAAWDGPLIAEYARDSQTGLLSARGMWAQQSHSGAYADLQVSNDGRHMYASDTQRDAIVIFDRDTSTGALSYHGEVRSGDPNVEGLVAPMGLAISSDDRFLYSGTSRYPYPVIGFSVGSDGGLTQIQNHACSCGLGDLELSSDGKRLWAGWQPVAVDRDPQTGLLSGARQGSPGFTGTKTADGTIAVSPDGGMAYGVDRHSNRLYEVRDGASGPTVTATHRDGVDAVLKDPRGAVISPDGRNVYVPSGQDPTQTESARIAVFQRDAGTGSLRFASLFTGPFMDGRPPSEQLPVTVQINEGDEYTNDPDVELTIAHVNPNGWGALLVSNDGGFPPGATTDLVYDRASEKYPWTLASSGPERLPKTVYVLAQNYDGKPPATDSIILDERPPAVDSAVVTAANRRLRIRAHDNVSGVVRMQITRDRRKPGNWRVYKRTAPAKPSGTTFVRVRDRARNVSRWRRAVIKR